MALHVLISAGPTQEALDPVRYLTNRSSGKMGYALADAAVARGALVTLVSGPVNLPQPEHLSEFVAVRSAAELAAAVKLRAAAMDVIIMAAAVADYRPKTIAAHKLKKGDGDLVLVLERTEDVLAALGRNKPAGQLLVGFAAETDDLLRNAQGKLERKNLDWIVANNVGASDRGFSVDANAVTMLARDGRIVELELADKRRIAEKILEVLGI